MPLSSAEQSGIMGGLAGLIPPPGDCDYAIPEEVPQPIAQLLAATLCSCSSAACGDTSSQADPNLPLNDMPDLLTRDNAMSMTSSTAGSQADSFLADGVPDLLSRGNDTLTTSCSASASNSSLVGTFHTAPMPEIPKHVLCDIRPPSPCGVDELPPAFDFPVEQPHPPEVNPAAYLHEHVAPAPSNDKLDLHNLYDMPLGYSPADLNVVHRQIVDNVDELFQSDAWMRSSGVVRQILVPGRIRAQTDCSANILVTNNKSILKHFWWIQPFPVSEWMDDNPTAHVTGMEYFPLRCLNGELLLLPCYYNEHAAETIISPNHFCQSDPTMYQSFLIHGDVATEEGYLRFDSPSGLHHVSIPMERRDSLWFVDTEVLTVNPVDDVLQPSDPDADAPSNDVLGSTAT